MSFAQKMIKLRSAWLALCGAVFLTCAMPYQLTAQASQPCNVQRVFATADHLVKLEQYTRAENALNRVAACKNMSPAQRFESGWLYGRAHDFKAALQAFQSVGPNVPDRLSNGYAIALTRFELEDYAGSIQALTALQSENLLDNKSATLLGVAYSKVDRYNDAYSVFAENLKKNPKELFAYLNLITLFTDTGHFSDAVGIADRAVAAFPQNPDVFVARGAGNALLGNMDRAHDDFSTAVRLAPHRTDPRFFLALSDYKRGKFEVAIAELRSAIRDDILDSDLHYLLAECILKAEPAKRSEAITELNRAIKLNGKSVSARTLRGRLLVEGGHAPEGLADLELAHQIDPESHSATYSLARADIALGKTQEAKALLAQLSTEKPDSLGELSEHRLQNALAGASSQ